MPSEVELSRKDKKELRKQRFFGALKDQNISTLDALEKLNEEKMKRLERAQKFGVVTNEIEEEKRK